MAPRSRGSDQALPAAAAAPGDAHAHGPLSKCHRLNPVQHELRAGVAREVYIYLPANCWRRAR